MNPEEPVRTYTLEEKVMIITARMLVLEQAVMILDQAQTETIQLVKAILEDDPSQPPVIHLGDV